MNSRKQHCFQPISASESSFEAFTFWLEKADFFQWPHFIVFDSFQHLKNLLYDKLKYPDDYIAISNRMKKYNQLKMQLVKQKLSEQLLSIQMHETPKLPIASYQSALKQILNVTNLQI